MTWNNPRIDWKAGDTPNSGDFNRIEANSGYMKDEIDTLKIRKATTTQLGQVIIGSGINVDNNGKISVPEIEILDEVTIYVNSSSGNDSNNGMTESTPYKTINKAIQRAKNIFCNRLTIRLSAGTYSITEPLEGIPANIIFLVSSGTSANTFIQSSISVDFTYGKYIRIMRLAIQSAYYGVIGLNQPGNIDVSEVKFENPSGGTGIKLIGSHYVRVANCVLHGGPSAISLEEVGVALIESGSALKTEVGSIVDLISVGSAKISSVSMAISSPAANWAGIRALSGSTVFMNSVSGALGATPIIECSGSIVMKGSSNTITGAADKKSNGGQIFTG